MENINSGATLRGGVGATPSEVAWEPHPQRCGSELHPQRCSRSYTRRGAAVVVRDDETVM